MGNVDPQPDWNADVSHDFVDQMLEKSKAGELPVKPRVELLEVLPPAVDVFGSDETGHDLRAWLTHPTHPDEPVPGGVLWDRRRRRG